MDDDDEDVMRFAFFSDGVIVLDVERGLFVLDLGCPCGWLYHGGCVCGRGERRVRLSLCLKAQSRCDLVALEVNSNATRVLAARSGARRRPAQHRSL